MHFACNELQVSNHEAMPSGELWLACHGDLLATEEIIALPLLPFWHLSVRSEKHSWLICLEHNSYVSKNPYVFCKK